MITFLSKYIDKLFFKQWIIGICKGDIKDIIRKKSFDPDIKWYYLDSFNKFFADPFFVSSSDGNQKILFEDYPFDDDYGKIALMTVDKDLRELGQKLILDTGSHLSYPFVYYENSKIYIFPEAAKSGKLSCYEYDPLTESVEFVKDIIELPLRDSTILKYRNKYWIFGIIAIGDTDYKMHIFYSDSLLGPYSPHINNPVRNGLDGTRPAGNFVEVDGILYRPAQNCKNGYGESITINRITELSEETVSEEPYLNIAINRKHRNNKRIHSIHTLNQTDNLLAVDGEQWTFAPLKQLRKYLGDVLPSGKVMKPIKN
jgi:hypothetical protein